MGAGRAGCAGRQGTTGARAPASRTLRAPKSRSLSFLRLPPCHRLSLSSHSLLPSLLRRGKG
eukprot:1393722-Rhodomonas_salina.1